MTNLGGLIGGSRGSDKVPEKRRLSSVLQEFIAVFVFLLSP